ncbi:hypothetical protein Tco_0313836, partial [Tanacetum coccineum]
CWRLCQGTDTFYNSLNSNDQDALDSAAGGNFLDKMPQEGLAIIESKSKVRYSRSRANDSRVSTDAPLSNSSSSNNSFDMQQIAASLEDKMTIKMNQMMSQMKALVVTPAPVKAVEEVCVTCGSNHNFNLCPLTRSGNDFPVFQDNIQQFQQTAAIGNFLQRNQPSNLASQMRPPGFNQPNVQTNQNRYQGTNSNFNQNRGGNYNQNRPNNQTQNQVYQAPPYQTPTNQPPINQVLPYQPPTNSVLKTDFENYVKANDAVLKNVQNQGQNLQNQMANVTSLLTSLCDNFKNSASTSSPGTLPSQTVTNPRQQINAITTRSDESTLEEGLNMKRFQEDVEIKNPTFPISLVFLNTPSLVNHDTSIVYSSKIDPILEEFAGELAHIAPIPPGIVEADFDPNDDTSSDDDDFEDIEYISLEEVEQEEKKFDLEDIFQVQDVILREKLLNVHRLISNIKSLKVNSTPDRVLESPSPFPIPVVDSDAFFEESDTSFSHLDNSLPEFETFSDHSEETRSGSTTTHANYSLPEYESFYFDDPSIPRPPPEPPDIEKCFEPKAGILIIKEFKGVSKSHDFMTSILPTLVSDLPFISSIVSFENEDTIFDPGIVTLLRAGGIF